MLYSLKLLPGKEKYLYILLLLLFIICGGFISSDKNDFDAAKKEVLLRRIGHEILLQAGDSTSRVLPVKAISENEYQISFENAFTFQPDSLVNITSRLLAKDPLVHDYIVNVRNCSSPSVMFGFAISGNEKDNIVACSGRVQPKACYMISLKFKPPVLDTARKGYLLGGLPILAFIGLILLRSVKQRKAKPMAQDTDMLPLGSFLFDTKKGQLILDGSQIDLTGTETRIMQIFASAPNEAIERARLQKEIWEDEGVIVGRSLDMFISKLRKKLEPDQMVKIVSIRGKGYKLEVSS
jgi:hypothetical protein